MARKKISMEAVTVEYRGGSKLYHDNHSPGISDLPSYAKTDPAEASYCNTPAAPGKKIHFPSMVAAGGSPNIGDVNVVNANGISMSKNRGTGQQWNSGNVTDGDWNRNEDWDGANLSGL